jgi:hypothetical protein|tara:strand:- start:36 stop:1142 length:1107 start_codon:yes stop_codon:yes gene_type:complete
MSKETPNYYGQIPAEVRYNKNLPPSAKLLYSELTALCNKEGYCWASNKYFAELYSTTKGTVSTWFSSLQKEGLIKIEVVKNRNGTVRKVYLEGLRKIVIPITKNRNHNNTSSNNKSNINITKESEDSFCFKSPFIKKCITIWNDISFTQNIRITKRTKTIVKLEKYINQLLRGTFLSGRGNKTFDVDWFNQNKIPITTKSFTKKEILITIKSTSLYSKEGYFTENKSHMPKDLATLMYNPRTGKSWFLLAYYKKPEPFNTLVDPDPKTSVYLADKITLPDKVVDYQKLYRGVTSIKKFVMNIPKRSAERAKIRREVGTALKICREYTYWIERQDWIDGINLSILNANNKLWKKFIKDKEKEYDGYKLS